jgi:hypothetical protein
MSEIYDGGFETTAAVRWVSDDEPPQWRDAVERPAMLHDRGPTTFVVGFTHSFNPKGDTCLLQRELPA